MRRLIINADGYGFTAGITRGIEECIAFGTVRSVSANVNFPHAERIPDLLRKHPDVSVGCHLNPVVGRPILPPKQIPSLVNFRGEFHDGEFFRRAFLGQLDREELRRELMAQVERTRQLAGRAFSHVDFHMNFHLIPTIFPLFLEIAVASGAGRIRTYDRCAGMESRHPRLRHLLFLLQSPLRIPKQMWYSWASRMARKRGLAMPDLWVGMSARTKDLLTLENHVRLVENLPEGISEFVVHPGYVDDELRKYASYLEEREIELGIFTSSAFMDAIGRNHVRLVGYRDIPLRRSLSKNG